MTAVASSLHTDEAPPESSAPEAAPQAASGLSYGGALGLLFAMLGFLIGSRLISDNSFFTHFANGRVILETGSVPTGDPYSFTAPGESVTIQSWLPSLVYAGLEQYVGEWAIRLLNGALAGIVAAGLWRLSATAKQLVPRVALVGSLVVIGAMMWGPRPLLFGLVAMLGLFLVLDRTLPLWTLPLIMWFWVNSHGSFPLGLAAVGAFGLGRFLDERRLPWHEIRVFAWATVGMLGGALNPLGVTLIWFPIHLLGRTEALENVIEWESPAFDSPLGMVFIGVILLHVLAARNGARWQHLLPSLAFVVAGIIAVRNLAPGSLVFAVCLAPYLELRSGSIVASARGFLPKALAVVSVTGITMAALVVVSQGALDLEAYPVDEVDWLEERSLVAQPDVRLAHRETTGNYLELRYGSDANVFVDDRFDFYPIEVLDDHDVLIFGGDFREVLDRNEVDVVLWDAESSFSSWLAEADEWTIAEQNDDFLIACRTASPVAARCLAD